MIDTKEQLIACLEQDAAASYRKSVKPHGLRDDVWKCQRAMRYAEYYANRAKQNMLFKPAAILSRQRFARLSVKLGFSFPYRNRIRRRALINISHNSRSRNLVPSRPPSISISMTPPII